jgi:hypothetical protein
MDYVVRYGCGTAEEAIIARAKSRHNIVCNVIDADMKRGD